MLMEHNPLIELYQAVAVPRPGRLTTPRSRNNFKCGIVHIQTPSSRTTIVSRKVWVDKKQAIRIPREAFSRRIKQTSATVG